MGITCQNRLKYLPEDDHELFLWNGWLKKALGLVSSQTFLDTLVIPNLQHVMNRIRTCDKRESRLCCMKRCNRNNKLNHGFWTIKMLGLYLLLGYPTANSGPLLRGQPHSPIASLLSYKFNLMFSESLIASSGP